MKKNNTGDSSKTIERESEPFKDFARVSVDEIPKQTKHRGGVGTHFPTLLHLVLTRAEKDGYGHICAWQAHGRCFSVFNRDLFVSEVMPNYFRQSQYASFQRQLNLYGFQRLSQKSLDHGSYYHEMFLRTRADLCQGILRAKEKDLRAVKAAREEPDFHKMTPMPPITEQDIGTTESILMRQKTGAKEGQELTKLVGGDALVKEQGDPLAKLFKTIAMNGIDTSDSWMEPRPIAPAVPAAGSDPSFMVGIEYSRQPMALPKPDLLPLPSFLTNTPQDSLPGMANEALYATPQSACMSQPDIMMRKVSEEKVAEKRPLLSSPDIEERSTKRQADEASCLKWLATAEFMQDEVAGMVNFLEDVDFD